MELPEDTDHIYKIYESPDGRVVLEAVDTDLMRRNAGLPSGNRATHLFLSLNGEVESHRRVGGLLPGYEKRVVRAASRMIKLAKNPIENEEN